MIDQLVVIAGAGASRGLGSNPLPLMSDWATTLRKALDSRQFGLSQLVGITNDQPGTAFEQAVGDFLAWQRVFDLAARYLPMGFAEAPHDQFYKEWGFRAGSNAKAVVETLNITLYEQFGMGCINPVMARDAYAALLDAVQLNTSGGLVTFATTNYDVAIETAMAELERSPDEGVVPGPSHTRYLKPEGLIAKCVAAKATPVLHLHGKVGWYSKPDGRVEVSDDSHPYNDSFGTPTVLMPDPNKDPLTQPAIRALWGEFELALSQCTHVLFLGHSLHDPVLLSYVRQYAGSRKIAVTIYPIEDETGRAEEERRIIDIMPQATIIDAGFGPDPRFGSFEKWAS